MTVVDVKGEFHLVVCLFSLPSLSESPPDKVSDNTVSTAEHLAAKVPHIYLQEEVETQTMVA